MRKDITTSAIGIVVLTLVLGVLYPLVLTGISQVAFPGNAHGQQVTPPDPKYFQSRPSATVPPDNAAATAFSNAGPNNIATEQAIAANIQAYIALEGPYVPGLTA